MSIKNINLYNLKGQFKNNGENVKFSHNIRSTSESDAKEKICLQLGANHKIKRLGIKFESVKLIKSDDDSQNDFATVNEFKLIKE